MSTACSPTSATTGMRLRSLSAALLALLTPSAGDVAFLDYGTLARIDDPEQAIAIGEGATGVGMDEDTTTSLLPRLLQQANVRCTRRGSCRSRDLYEDMVDFCEWPPKYRPADANASYNGSNNSTFDEFAPIWHGSLDEHCYYRNCPLRDAAAYCKNGSFADQDFYSYAQFDDGCGGHCYENETWRGGVEALDHPSRFRAYQANSSDGGLANVSHLMAIVGGVNQINGNWTNDVLWIPYPQAQIQFLYHTSGQRYGTLPKLRSWTERALTDNLDTDPSVRIGVAADSFAAELPSENDASRTVRAITIPGHGIDPSLDATEDYLMCEHPPCRSWHSMWYCRSNRYPYGVAECTETEMFASKPIFSPRRHAAVIGFKGKLWVLGGEAKESEEHTTLRSDVWSTSDGVNWNLTNPGCDRWHDYYAPAFFTDCYGDSNFTSPKRQTCECETWSQRILHSVTTDGDRLYVLGGRVGNDSYVLNGTRGTWVEERLTVRDGYIWDNEKGWSLDTASGVTHPSHACEDTEDRHANPCTTDGVSTERNPYYNDVWSSPDGQHWYPQTRMAEWSRRAGMGFISVEGKMYMVGGRNLTHMLNDMWISHDKGRKWEQVTFPVITPTIDSDTNADTYNANANADGTDDVPIERTPHAAFSPRYGFTLVAKYSELTGVHALYMYGGETETGHTTSQVWMWPISRTAEHASQWIEVTDRSDCGTFGNRSHMVSMQVDGELFLLGGYRQAADYMPKGHDGPVEPHPHSTGADLSEGTTLELSALGSNWVSSEPMLMHEQVLPQTCQRKPEWVLERQWGQRYIPPCPHGWYQEAPNCYWIGPDLQTATEAEKTCAKEGAHLASISSEQEHDYLFALLKDLDQNLANAWIGVKRTIREFDYNAGGGFNDSAVQRDAQLAACTELYDSDKCSFVRTIEGNTPIGSTVKGRCINRKCIESEVVWTWSDGSPFYYRRWAQGEPNEEWEDMETIAELDPELSDGTALSAPLTEDCATIRFKKRSQKFDAWVNMKCDVEGLPACKRLPDDYHPWLEHQTHITCAADRFHDHMRYLRVGRCYSEMNNSFWVETSRQPAWNPVSQLWERKPYMRVCIGRKDCSCLDWHRRVEGSSYDFNTIEDYQTEDLYPLGGSANGPLAPITEAIPNGVCNVVRLEPPRCIGITDNETQCIYTGNFKPNTTYSHMLKQNNMEANGLEANSYENTTFRFELAKLKAGYGPTSTGGWEPTDTTDKLFLAQKAIAEGDAMSKATERTQSPGDWQWLTYTTYTDFQCGEADHGMVKFANGTEYAESTQQTPQAFSFGGRPLLARGAIENVSHRAIGMCYQYGRWGPSERFECLGPDHPEQVELVKYATEDCGGIVLSRLRFDRGQCLSGLSSGDAPSGTPGPFAPPNSELQSDASFLAMANSRRASWSGECKAIDSGRSSQRYRTGYTESAYPGDHCGHFIDQFGNTTTGYRVYLETDVNYNSGGSHACGQEQLKQIVCDVLRHPTCLDNINSCECLTLKYQKIAELQRAGHYWCARNALCVGAVEWEDTGGRCCQKIQTIPRGNCRMLCEYEIRYRADGLVPLNGQPRCSIDVCANVDNDLPYLAAGTGWYFPESSARREWGSAAGSWLLALVTAVAIAGAPAAAAAADR